MSATSVDHYLEEILKAGDLDASLFCEVLISRTFLECSISNSIKVCDVPDIRHDNPTDGIL